MEVVASKQDFPIYRRSRSNLCESPRLSRGFTYGNYGFGPKAHASNRVGFRFDLKGILSRTPTFGLPRQSDDPNATVFPAGGAFPTAEISAGLIFYLD